MKRPILIALAIIFGIVVICIVCCAISFILVRNRAIYDFDHSTQTFPEYTSQTTVDGNIIKVTSQSTHPLFGDPLIKFTITNKDGESKEISYSNPNFRKVNIYILSDAAGNQYLRIPLSASWSDLYNLKTFQKIDIITGDGLYFDLSNYKSDNHLTSKYVQCIKTNGVKKYYYYWDMYYKKGTEAVVMNIKSAKYVGEFNWEDSVVDLKFLSADTKPESPLMQQNNEGFFACS